MQNYNKVCADCQQRAVKAGLPVDLLTLLLPMILELASGWISSCLSKNARTTVAAAVAGNSPYAIAMRQRAIREACKNAGVSLAPAQIAALSAAVKETATTQSMSVVSAADELSHPDLIDLSAFATTEADPE